MGRKLEVTFPILGARSFRGPVPSPATFEASVLGFLALPGCGSCGSCFPIWRALACWGIGVTVSPCLHRFLEDPQPQLAGTPWEKCQTFSFSAVSVGHLLPVGHRAAAGAHGGAGCPSAASWPPTPGPSLGAQCLFSAPPPFLHSAAQRGPSP